MEEYPFFSDPTALLDEFGLEPGSFDATSIEETFQTYQEIYQQYAQQTLKQGKQGLFSTAQVHDFVQEQDKPYLVLLKYLYEEASAAADYPWALVPDLPQSDHISVWENVETQQIFVGCRGTSPLNPGGWQDLADDIQITFGVQPLIQTLLNASGTSGLAPTATLVSNDVCNTMFITQQGQRILDQILKKVPAHQVVVGGHSLGGRAAACLVVQYDLARVVLFNAAAPATNPLRTGLGPARQIHYHIGGDLISSHSDSSKMTVVIVDNSTYPIPSTTSVPPMLMPPGEMRSTFPRITIHRSLDFDLVGHHLLTNFLKSKPARGQLSVDEYDAIWVYWSNHFSQEWGKSLLVGVMTLGLMNLLLYYVAWNCPIPNSRRAQWLQRLSSFCQNSDWRHVGDRISCLGRQTWNRTLWLLLGPLVTPFFTAFYGVAFSAVAAVAGYNSFQALNRSPGARLSSVVQQKVVPNAPYQTSPY